MKTYITYIRTSTRGQDLGLEAQQSIINKFIDDGDIIIGAYSEQESGSRKNRVELNKAISACVENNAILLIAKLDRLSRNVAFISSLMESNIEIKVADMPNANKFTLHILASVAQNELDDIQKRTKDALEVIKTNIERDGYHISKAGNRITRLGNSVGISDDVRVMGRQAVQERIANNPNLIKARAFASSLRKGGSSLRDIAKHLNDNDFKSARGGMFYASTVTTLFN